MPSSSPPSNGRMEQERQMLNILPNERLRISASRLRSQLKHVLRSPTRHWFRRRIWRFRRFRFRMRLSHYYFIFIFFNRTCADGIFSRILLHSSFINPPSLSYAKYLCGNLHECVHRVWFFGFYGRRWHELNGFATAHTHTHTHDDSLWRDGGGPNDDDGVRMHAAEFNWIAHKKAEMNNNKFTGGPRTHTHTNRQNEAQNTFPFTVNVIIWLCAPTKWFCIKSHRRVSRADTVCARRLWNLCGFLDISHCFCLPASPTFLDETTALWNVNRLGLARMYRWHVQLAAKHHRSAAERETKTLRCGHGNLCRIYYADALYVYLRFDTSQWRMNSLILVVWQRQPTQFAASK